eukprot:XP_011441257.1 PREDICTED: L-ascorbate oxidase [Crassostrea gigas]
MLIKNCLPPRYQRRSKMFTVPASVLLLLGVMPISVCFQCEKNVPHCVTSLIVDNSFTMIDKEKGPLYTENRKVLSARYGQEVDINSVITADGWNMTRKLITANGTMPGPDIIVHQNQKITIVVYNHLLSEEISIHWHGIEQFGTPAMDGVPFVTQCPILPGQSFNYTFTPHIGGTYFYHSHSGVQSDMGLFGAFVVLRERDPTPLECQKIVQLQEWNHLHDPETILKSLNHVDTTADPINYFTGSHSVLINGRGEYDNNMAPLTVFRFNVSETYLLRVISASSNKFFLFSIPGIKLTVKETDGDEILPITVDKIIIYPGERYDIELNLQSVPEGLYNITVNLLVGRTLVVNREKNVGIAMVHVTNSINSYATVLNDSDTSEVVLNCPFLIYPNEPNFTCVPVSQLKSMNLEKEIHVNKKSNRTASHFLNFSYRGTKQSAVNGRIFRNPSVAALIQPDEVDVSCPRCDAENYCTCSYSVNLETGAEIILVMSNLGKEFLDTHPIHIHGHKFQILRMGLLSITSTGDVIPTNDLRCSESLTNEESLCYSVKWDNKIWNNLSNIPDINFQNGVRKDTIILPAGGYVVARIWATNPGVWLLHCHMTRHLFEGMAVMLNESFQHVVNLPSDIPICTSFYNKKKYLPQNTETTTPSSQTITKSTQSVHNTFTTKSKTSMFGENEDSVVLGIIITLAVLACLLVISNLYTIHVLRSQGKASITGH